MPDQDFHLSIRFLPEHYAVVGRLSGAVSAADMFRAMEALYLDPRWQPGYKLLWDDRRLTSIALNRQEGRGVADRIEAMRPRIGDGKVACIIPNEVLAAISDMLAGLAELSPEQVRIFETAGEALAWLELPPDVLEE